MSLRYTISLCPWSRTSIERPSLAAHAGVADLFQKVENHKPETSSKLELRHLGRQSARFMRRALFANETDFTSAPLNTHNSPLQTNPRLSPNEIASPNTMTVSLELGERWRGFDAPGQLWKRVNSMRFSIVLPRLNLKSHTKDIKVDAPATEQVPAFSMALSSKSLAGPGYIILNVIRVMNIIGLLAVIVASIVMLVKTSVASKFFFFDAVSHVLTAVSGSKSMFTRPDTANVADHSQCFYARLSYHFSVPITLATGRY
nr:hypothetical protein CFP56_52554 [Quercus suber]